MPTACDRTMLLRSPCVWACGSTFSRESPVGQSWRARPGLHRTIQRSLDAQAAGRTPGKSGRAIQVQGSKGGPNGARAVRRAARRARGRAAAPPSPSLTQKPAAATAQEKTPASCGQPRKKPAMAHQLGLLEVCAYPGSSLSRAFAQRGQSAVRIAHRKQKDEEAKPGPEPVTLG